MKPGGRDINNPKNTTTNQDVNPGVMLDDETLDQVSGGDGNDISIYGFDDDYTDKPDIGTPPF